jgi:hypothetical protein
MTVLEELPKHLAVFRSTLQSECVTLALKAFEDMPVLAARTRDFLNGQCSDSMAQILDWCATSSAAAGNQDLDESLNGALELVDRLSVNLAAMNRWTRTEDVVRRTLGEKICEWQRWCDSTVQQVTRFYVARSEIPASATRALQVSDAAAFREAREISEMVLCAALEFISLFPQLSKRP